MQSRNVCSRRLALGALCLIGFVAGCQEGGLLRPLRVGVTKHDLITAELWPRWHWLRVDLGLYLGQVVQFEPLTPYQMRVHLGNGRLVLAMVDAPQYAHIAGGNNHILLATAVNAFNATERVGLIVTRADSEIQTLADLKGKRFDFGPKDDPLLDTVALAALAEAGITRDDLEKSILFNDLFRHINSYEVAKAVAYENVAGGIIDEADYAKMPDKGGTILLGLVSKDQFRVLHRLSPMPEMVVIASKEADPVLVAKAREYFLEAVNKRPLTKIRLGLMGIKEFRPATPEAYVPFTKWYNAVCPPEEPEEFDGGEETQTSGEPQATQAAEEAVPKAP
ncbi:MAG: PhnD/SsuA/transferrin family substrate-binding protein [Phycisphaerae bacterium]|nr:PhnD/SsuA/transferrin family substrate-binding protein [Phycisphaerae bacterium]